MRLLQHPNVVQLYNVYRQKDSIFLIMELCGGGSLYEHLTEKPFDEPLSRYYFTKLIDGLSYCHSKVKSN